MITLKTRRRLPALACAVWLLASGLSGAPGPMLTLAILPCTDVEATFRKFYPLVEHIRKATGITVTLVVPATIEELEASLKNAYVDVVLQDPHTYERLSGLFDKTTLLWVVAPDGTTSQSGVVVVRADSGITELSQLHGRRVLFGPRTSTAKWVAAKRLFEASGLSVDRDIKATNGGCCDDIAFAVSLRSVDAGVICDHFLAGHESKQRDLGVDRRTLRVIARTAPFPTRVLAARHGAPRDAVAVLERALLRLDASIPGDAPVLSPTEILKFRRVAETEYLRLVEPRSTKPVR